MLGEQYHDDCKKWLGSKPCVIQKAGLSSGCDGCNYFEPINSNVLIIEAGGLGSILKASVIANSLAKVGRNIQWLTHSPGQELLVNVTSVDVTHNIKDPFAATILQNQKWDTVINFETNPYSLALTRSLQADQKFGFHMNDLGKLTICNEEALALLQMQTDDLYRATQNSKTFQQILLETAGIPWTNQQYKVTTDPQIDLEVSKAFDRLEIPKTEVGEYKLVGLNIGSSKRMNAKRWSADNFYQLSKKIMQEHPDWKVAILAGPDDEGPYQELESYNDTRLMFTGIDNPIKRFLSLVRHIPIVVSADTFGLHAAIALDKRTISLYGPYPANENLIPANGIVLDVELACSPCFAFRPDECINPVKLKCMRDITVGMVEEAVKKQIAETEHRNG